MLAANYNKFIRPASSFGRNGNVDSEKGKQNKAPQHFGVRRKRQGYLNGVF